MEEAPQGAANALRIVGMFLGVLFGLFVVAVLLVLVFMLIWG